MLEINQIHNIECIKGMSLIDDKTINMVFTSPPYNVSYRKDLKRYTEFDDCMSEEEYINFTLKVFKSYQRILKDNGVVAYNISYSVKNPSLLFRCVSSIVEETDFDIVDTIIWKKKVATPNSVNHNRLTRICEFIFIFAKKQSIDDFYCNKPLVEKSKNGQRYYKNILNFVTAENNDKSIESHSATFSCELVRKIVYLYSKEGDLILDNFMGTGTTAFGCKQIRRRYIGFEITKDYVDIANNRLKQTTLFPLDTKQNGGNGIPPTNKLVGILPKVL